MEFWGESASLAFFLGIDAPAKMLHHSVHQIGH